MYPLTERNGLKMLLKLINDSTYSLETTRLMTLIEIRTDTVRPNIDNPAAKGRAYGELRYLERP
jgi:hypothetical protein